MNQRFGTNRNKGNSLLDFPSDYILLDVETTGFDPRYDQIIEIGAVRVSNDSVVDELSFLVKPKFGTLMIPDHITEKTGITEEMVSIDGIFIDDAIIKLHEFVGESLICGYNINFDINFVYDALKKYHNLDFSNDYVDFLRIARRFFKEEKRHRLIDVLSYANIDIVQEHRGLSDCLTTKKVYDYIKNNSDAALFESIKKYQKSYKINANDIVASTDDIDVTNPIFDKNICFTGKLDLLTRQEAMQLVKNLGATPQNGVNKQTNFLILGDTSYSTNVKNGVTGKMKKALDLQQKGQDIEVLSETVFFDLIQ